MMESHIRLPVEWMIGTWIKCVDVATGTGKVVGERIVICNAESIDHALPLGECGCDRRPANTPLSDDAHVGARHFWVETTLPQNGVMKVNSAGIRAVVNKHVTVAKECCVLSCDAKNFFESYQLLKAVSASWCTCHGGGHI